MEIVLLFCFGDGVCKLDLDVFEMFMRYVIGVYFVGVKREFLFFFEFGGDSILVVRFFFCNSLLI